MFSARGPSDVDRFFRGLTEYAFHARLGVVDPPLVDYVAVLLVRFMRNERLAVLPGAGEESADVTHMLLAAKRHADAAEAREEYRHIGDVTLFWSGLYPEAIARHRTPGPRADLVGYKEAGKRAYELAARSNRPKPSRGGPCWSDFPTNTTSASRAWVRCDGPGARRPDRRPAPEIPTATRQRSTSCACQGGS